MKQLQKSQLQLAILCYVSTVTANIKFPQKVPEKTYVQPGKPFTINITIDTPCSQRVRDFSAWKFRNFENRDMKLQQYPYLKPYMRQVWENVRFADDNKNAVEKVSGLRLCEISDKTTSRCKPCCFYHLHVERKKNKFEASTSRITGFTGISLNSTATWFGFVSSLTQYAIIWWKWRTKAWEFLQF